VITSLGCNLDGVVDHFPAVVSAVVEKEMKPAAGIPYVWSYLKIKVI
jgi:hypothetical protein